MKVRFTPVAKGQFLSAIKYIAKDRPSAAKAFAARARRALTRLESHPLSGRRLPEFPQLPHREVVVPPYRFFYRIDKKLVWIVAVWHGAQMPQEP